VAYFSTDKAHFLGRNLLRGFLLLSVIIGGYFIATEYFNFDLKEAMGDLYESPRTIFGIFLISEVVFGIIPPEFFFIWSLRHQDAEIYVGNVVILMAISYAAGVLGYWFGAYLNSTQVYQQLKRRIFGKFEEHFMEYGGFLVIVAALTPIPFSGICMLVGSFRYPFNRFLVIAMARFVRFAVYSYIIWKANVVVN
jgi:membrane protein YqaA with SNARE-associated domain